MNKNEKKFKLISITKYSKNDPQNPRNIDPKKVINELEEKSQNEKKEKKVIINGNKK